VFWSDSAEAQPILVAPILNFISILVHDVIWERAGGHHGACYIRLKDFESDIMLIVCPRLALERTMLWRILGLSLYRRWPERKFKEFCHYCIFRSRALRTSFASLSFHKPAKDRAHSLGVKRRMQNCCWSMQR
jgi:hypothetical protein